MGGKIKYNILAASVDYAKRNYTHEAENSLRDKFCRDRDRILFSKEFRRLNGKTQVFVNGFDDHVRNRLTHTLEVSQISQTIANNLGLNHTLAEAISLSHDVGHTPFGHIGERTLNQFTNNCENYDNFKIEDSSQLGFKHNWQGVKVVSSLERISSNYKGLNLTDYTIWGILNHSSLTYNKECDSKNGILCKNKNYEKNCHINSENQFSLSHYNSLNDLVSKKSWTLEAMIVKNADEIAQRHHDVEDGLTANIIGRKDFSTVFGDIFNEYLLEPEKELLKNIKDAKNLNYSLHDIGTLILSFYSRKLLENTEIELNAFIKSNSIKKIDDFNSFKVEAYDKAGIFSLVNFTKEFNEKDKNFQQYLINRILNSHLAQSMDGKASYIIRNLIKAYMSNPKQLPDGTIDILNRNFYSDNEYTKIISKIKTEQEIIPVLRQNINSMYNTDSKKFKIILIRTITDFIAGMTDKFAISQFKTMYGTDNNWHH